MTDETAGQTATGLEGITREVAEAVTVMDGAAALITGYRGQIGDLTSQVANLQKLVAERALNLPEVDSLLANLQGLGLQLDEGAKRLEAAMAVNTPANAEVVNNPDAAAAIADVVDASNPTNPDAPTS